MLPWNDWFHVNGNTYGTWLRGDPRGWRARHHREHVDGDYKNPPAPGTYDRLHAHSQRLMKRPAVHLSQEARALACQAMVDSLLRHRVELISLCVDDHHYHLLARFGKPTDSDPWASVVAQRRDGKALIAVARHCVGIAKKDSATALSDAGLAARGGVWAKRCRVPPIGDRAHQLNVYRYIVNHAERAAAVWTFEQRSRGA